MRFSAAIVTGLVAIVYAQDDATTVAATTVEAPTITAGAVSSEQSAQAVCLESCDDDDVDCRAACVGVPNPTEENISANDACVAACDIGDGSDEDSAAYSECVSGCIASYYFTASGALAGATGVDTADASDSTATDDTDSDSDSDSDSDDADSTTDEDSSTSTESSADASSTDSSDDDSAAGLVGVSTASIGLVAFLAAFAAL